MTITVQDEGTVLAPIDMEAFEDAVHAWFADSILITAVWRNMAAPQPPYPYGSLLITSGPIPVAPQWEQRTATDRNRPLGQEVEVEVCVPCAFVVSCQVYVGQPCARNPDKKATFYLNAAQSRLSLPSVLQQLRDAGVAVVRPGPVLNIDELIEDAWVSRASMDVTFGATLSLREYTGYIERVHAKSESLGIDQTFGGMP